MPEKDICQIPVLVRQGALEELVSLLQKTAPRAQKILLVTDRTVGALYAKNLTDLLSATGKPILLQEIPCGEAGKQLSSLTEILKRLTREHFSRFDLVLALGGGCVCDTAALAASLYQRGMCLVLLPTTLLCAVDAGIGGKTAINFGGIKNQIGSFYLPDAVLCDTRLLCTLPPEEMKNGYAEIIKCTALFDAALFSALQQTPLKEMELSGLISFSIHCKRRLASQDLHDLGQRRLLNFGHTLGHAVEQLSHFEIPHGHAVSIGMVLITRALESLPGYAQTADRLAEVLKKNGLPVQTVYSADELVQAAAADKKRCGDQITLAALPDFGQGTLITLSLSDLRARLARILSV